MADGTNIPRMLRRYSSRDLLRDAGSLVVESPTTCILRLNDDGSPVYPGFVTLPPGTKLKFIITVGLRDTSCMRLLTNYPMPGEPFRRTVFVPIVCEQSSVNDGEWEAELDVVRPGPYEFVLVYTDLQWGPPFKPLTGNLSGPVGYFLVEPQLMVGGEQLEPDNINLQSVLTKCLGVADTWESTLKLASLSGFNFIHFTPIQPLGESNSSFSVWEQVAFNPMLMPEDVAKLSLLEQADYFRARLRSIEENLGLLSMVDVVLNHTASNSGFLAEHPEVGYTLDTAPQLKAAWEFDELMLVVSEGVAAGRYPGVSARMDSDGAIQAVIDTLHREVNMARFHEYFTVDLDGELRQLRAVVGPSTQSYSVPADRMNDLVHVVRAHLFNDGTGDRYGVHVEWAKLWPKLRDLLAPCTATDGSQIEHVLKTTLLAINQSLADRAHEDLEAAMRAIGGGARHLWLTERKGKGKISAEHPLVHRYFTTIGGHIFANNGFIWNGDPAIDFALPIDIARQVSDDIKAFIGMPATESKHPEDTPDTYRQYSPPPPPITFSSTPYFRRDVVIWGDCVKLRYGVSPADSPWLWNHMVEYVQLMASMFHGFRLDNAHGTPVHVSAYMMDAARQVRPNLYICAELFTGSVFRDVEYVVKVGISALVREAMRARDACALSSLLYGYGGHPVGSIRSPYAAVRECIPAPLPVMFFDCTHDNETPHQLHHPCNALPLAALVSAAHCASGSVRGFDELVARNPSVVTEYRPYFSADILPVGAGIHPARAILNALRKEMGSKGFWEVHVHYYGEPDGTLVSIQRSHPVTRESFVYICRTAFFGGVNPEHNYVDLPAVYVEGRAVDVELCARLRVDQSTPDLSDMGDTITGQPSELLMSVGHLHPSLAHLEDNGTGCKVILHREFQPGSVIVLRVRAPACLSVSGAPPLPHAYVPPRLVASVPPSQDLPTYPELQAALAREEVSLTSLNHLLFRSDPEEKDTTRGNRGAYVIDGYGPLEWCGLAGSEAVLRHIRRTNDMGHSLLDNIRRGPWLADYLVARLDGVHELGGVQHWLFQCFEAMKSLPSGLQPQAFDRIVYIAYTAACEAVFDRLSGARRVLSVCPAVTRQLIMGSVQLFADVPSAPLLALPLVMSDHPYPAWRGYGPSLAAGQPHFATQFMRNWGRDTFISLRGLLLIPGRFQEARSVLLSYAAVTRHGLIPNLMDGGRRPRYNARDAVWWFMQALQEYCNLAPEGLGIFSAIVHRRFPCDRQEDHVEDHEVDQTLADIVHEILEKHANGIEFVEWNAGKQLDSHMTPSGFHIRIMMNRETGILYGGNSHNCGTWMDKMGESPECGTDGKPATPRDGAAIEITALLFSAVSWLSSVANEVAAVCPASSPSFHSVSLHDGTELLLSDWSKRILNNFERLYYVPVSPADDHRHDVNPKVANVRGIYKDTVGASAEWADYQLRPNVLVAMTVAPALFDTDHAEVALQNAELRLLGKGLLGVRTLDPDDWAYRGNYHVNDDSNDASVAKGFNYHQGPEWLWPMGYYLRARMRFLPPWLMPATPPTSPPSHALKRTDSAGCLVAGRISIESLKDRSVVRQWVAAVLAPHRYHLSFVSTGLPELTNSNNSVCHDGCYIQAWSAATLLDALFELAQPHSPAALF